MTIEKTALTTYTPGSPGIPGSPGRPAIPAYDEVVTTTTEVFVIDRIHTTGGSTDSLEAVSNPSGITFIEGHYETVTTTQIIHHEAIAAVPPTAPVPPTPAQFTVNYRLGWNAGAYSRTRLEGDVQVNFKIPKLVSGIFIGLSNVSASQHYREIKHAFRFFDQRYVAIYESGQRVGDLFTFIGTDTFRIYRVNSVVYYYKNSTLLYTSLVSSTGSLVVDCSLYGAGDKID